jgi:hypothetical protein
LTDHPCGEAAQRAAYTGCDQRAHVSPGSAARLRLPKHPLAARIHFRG